jgi:hypothetical protein
MPWDAVMHKWKAGQLKSGGSGKPVKSQKQAVAIMLSEKRASATKPEYAATYQARKSGKNVSYADTYKARHP